MSSDRRLRGTPAAPGRARGPLLAVREQAVGTVAAEADLGAVRAAASRAAARLEGLAGRSRASSPAAAAILEAQALILGDPALEATVAELLPGRSAAEAVLGAAG